MNLANVSIIGTKVTVNTNSKGFFKLPYNGKYPVIIEISYIGYTTLSKKIKNSKRTVKIYIESTAIQSQKIIVRSKRKKSKFFGEKYIFSKISLKCKFFAGGPICRQPSNTSKVPARSMTPLSLHFPVYEGHSEGIPVGGCGKKYSGTWSFMEGCLTQPLLPWICFSFMRGI